MIKVCHLTSVHPYNDIRIFFKECQELAESGFEVHLISINAPSKKIDGVYIHGIDYLGLNRLNRMTKGSKLVYKKAKEIDADIYHFHDPELIPIGLKLKGLGKKVIYDVHEDVPREVLNKTWIPKLLRRFVSIIFETYENYATKRFDGIVTATPFINNRFKSIGCNSVNINNYPILSELHTPKIKWENKEKIVCYVGLIGKLRGLFEMIEAINKTSDINLFLAGRIDNNDEKISAMEKEGWRQVKDLGYLDRKQVSNLLSRSLAGLVLFHEVPNHTNAQPNKMFEYMSAGLPVIASNFPLWKEIIEGNNCGICVDPTNIEKIANAIQWIADNPKEAQKMGENGRNAIEVKYNWETESKKLIKFYKEILAENN